MSSQGKLILEIKQLPGLVKLKENVWFNYLLMFMEVFESFVYLFQLSTFFVLG